jgi:hypothetical protein
MLFAEDNKPDLQLSVAAGEMFGDFPQGLTHLSPDCCRQCYRWSECGQHDDQNCNQSDCASQNHPREIMQFFDKGAAA